MAHYKLPDSSTGRIFPGDIPTNHIGGTWCPYCKILTRYEAKICGLCESPVVPIQQAAVDELLVTDNIALKKVEKGDIVWALVDKEL